jgi:hypothetical protein
MAASARKQMYLDSALVEERVLNAIPTYIPTVARKFGWSRYRAQRALDWLVSVKRADCRIAGAGRDRRREYRAIGARSGRT